MVEASCTFNAKNFVKPALDRFAHLALLILAIVFVGLACLCFALDGLNPITSVVDCEKCALALGTRAVE